MKIAFLFGSGISLPAGYPKTSDITDRVFSAKDVIHHTDQRYYIDPNFPNDEIGMYHTTIPQVLEFMKILKNEFDYYYHNLGGKVINYEDIYFLVSELYNNDTKHFENPAISFFKQHIKPSLLPLLKFGDKISSHNISARELFEKTIVYIKNVVSFALEKNVSEYSYLDFLKNMYNDELIDKAFIFTLNHDVLLENYLTKEHIKFIDGFTKPVNNMRYWNPKLYRNKNKISIYKIHGSINWFNFREDSGNWYSDKIGIATHGNIYRNKSINGKSQTTFDYYPRVLIGTYNKLYEYSSGIFLDLILLLYQHLENVDNLIICGYSFGDKGINNRIINWVYKKQKRRIVIIHKNIEKLKKDAKGEISNKIDLWINNDVLKIIPKKIEETNWKEIKSNLLKCP
jgi:hypothetical protein